MLMGGGAREAKIHYLDGTFRMLSACDHVRCAITGAIIPLDELRYWSVERQEAYADAAASIEAERRNKYRRRSRACSRARGPRRRCGATRRDSC